MRTRTVWIYWLLSALYKSSISFCFGYYVIFLHAHGLTPAQIMLPNIAYWAIKCFSDVPTGIMADLFGRKLSFIVACVLMAGGTALYSQVSTLGLFILAESLIAVGSTCESGAFEAWFNARYERELATDRESYSQALNQIYNQREMISNGFSMVASVVGAYSSVWGLGIPFALCSMLYLTTALCAWVLMEDTKSSAQPAPNRKLKAGSRDVFLQALRSCKHERILSCSLFGVILAIAMQPANMYWALVLSSSGVATKWFGMAWVLIIIACTFGMWIAKRTSGSVAPNRWFMATGSITLVALIGAGIARHFSVIVFCFLLHELGRGLFGVSRRSHLGCIAQREQDDVQATILSIDSTAQSIAAVAGLTFGALIVGTVGPLGTWICTSAICLVALVLWFWCFGRPERSLPVATEIISVEPIVEVA
ncbi:MAG: MFS transporter [Candidatus Andersenbacteria bacterium]